MDTNYGLVGEKLGHSFSPTIHAYIFKELNIIADYKLYEFKQNELSDIMSTLKRNRIKGVNVTIPYKVSIMKYLDDISDEAKKIAAINTISIKDNFALGYNTDYYGFGMMLKKYEVNVSNKNVVVLGTGGAAKSTIQYLVDNNVKNVIVVSRDVNEAKRKLAKLNIISYQDINKLSNQNIIINATPCGMHPRVDESPLGLKDFCGFDIAIDLIYNPLQTLFLKQAKNHGLNTINGLYMLVGQAVKAQEIWQNIKINENITDSIYKKILSLKRI